jgi:transcriptional regulator with XRE-family HTH domain
MATGITSYHTDSDRARMRNEVRQQVVSKLTDKEYRDIFVSEQINTGLAFQIHAMREQRGWSQAELGEKAGMAQSRISIMEDANYSRFSLNTLKRLASAFDVALVVRFEPYSKLVNHFIHLDSTSLDVPNFENDSFVNEVAVSNISAPVSSHIISGTVLVGRAVPYPQAFGTTYNLNLAYPEGKAIMQPIYLGSTEDIPFSFTNLQTAPAERVEIAA